MEFAKNRQSFLQSYNKSLINQACSGPYWENIGPRSFLYGPRCARSVLSRPRADTLPVWPSRLVNKVYVFSYKLTSDLSPIKKKKHYHNNDSVRSKETHIFFVDDCEINENLF